MHVHEHTLLLRLVPAQEIFRKQLPATYFEKKQRQAMNNYNRMVKHLKRVNLKIFHSCFVFVHHLETEPTDVTLIRDMSGKLLHNVSVILASVLITPILF